MSRWPRNIVRVIFALVFIINVQCAVQFVVWPQSFMGAYELSGTAGAAAIQGIGVAFLMWNATYPAFIAQPDRFRVLGWVIIAQQVIGLIGESAILATLASGHELLASSILRFIAFDAIGLVIMAIALILYTVRNRPENKRA